MACPRQAADPPPVGSQIENYTIYRAPKGGVAEKLADVAASTTTYEDEGLPHGSTWTYWVKMVTEFEDDSPLSDPTTNTTYEVPDPPENVATEPGPSPGEITVSWDAPPNEVELPVTEIRLYDVTDGSRTLLATLEPSAGSFIHTGLADWENRTYEMTAVNDAGEGPASPPVDGTAPHTPTPPQNPSIREGPGVGNLTVSWDPPAEEGGIDYDYIVYRQAPGGSVEQIATLDTAERYTDTDRTPDDEWYYSITAINDVGESDTSNEVLGVGPTTPTAVRSLTSEPGPGAGEIQLDWQVPYSQGGEPVQEYNVYRSRPDGHVGHEPVTYYLHRTDCGGSTDRTFMDRSNTGRDGGDGCGNLFHPIGPLVGGASQRFPADPAPAANIPLNDLDPVDVRLYLSGFIPFQGRTLVPSVVNDIEVRLLADGELVGSDRRTNELILRSPTPVDFSFSPNTNEIPAGSNLVFTFIVHHATGPVFAHYGGDRASHVTLPGGTQWLPVGNTTDQTSFVDEGMTGDVVYEHHVQPVNEWGSGPNASVEGPTPTVPDPPTAVSAEPNPSAVHAVTVSWDPPSFDGGAEIEAYRVYASDGPTHREQVAEIPAGQGPYTDARIPNFLPKGHRYWVSAVNGAGEGPMAGPACATTWIYDVPAYASLTCAADEIGETWIQLVT